MYRIRTVRFSYFYIFAGSALLSSAVLFVVVQAVSLLYAHYPEDSGALFVRLIHWNINYIGTKPSVMFLFVAIFSGIYMFRSQKIADDLQLMVMSTAELADKGSAPEIKVLSGGELGEIAANLNRIHIDEVIRHTEPPNRVETHAITLLLRTRVILQALGEVGGPENEESDLRQQLALAYEEARSMERFLENLVIKS